MQTAPNQMIELAVLPPADRAVAAINAQAAEQHLRALVEKSAEIQNVVDKNGRDEAHRAAMGLKNARVAIQNTGETAREDAVAFQKAVLAEVKRLAAITAAEESRLLGLRDAYDDRIAEEKARAERIEADRKAKHRERIDSILTLPARHVGDSASALTQVLEVLARRDVAAEGFEEFTEEAAAAIDTAAASLIEMQKNAAEREEAARQERVRQEAEARKLQAERAALEAQRAEQARIAAEQAEAARVLAEQQAAMLAQQQAEAKRQQDEAAARERAAAEQRRIEQEAADAERRKIAQAAADLAEQRAAFAREQQEAIAASEARERASAVVTAPPFDIDWDEPPAPPVVEILPPEPEFPALADAAELFTDADLVMTYEGKPDDEELIDLICSTYDMQAYEAIERLAAFNATRARELYEVPNE